MTALATIAAAWQSQYQARTKWGTTQEALDRAAKLTTVCLRMSDYPELAEVAPTAGEFEVDGYKIIRRKVDELDNIYATRS